MTGLLAVERMVLESIDKDKCTLEKIVKDTKLSAMFVRTILFNLKEYGLIDYIKGHYSLCSKKESLRSYNKPDLVKFELSELFESLVHNHYADKDSDELTLKMQKIWLTDSEFKILRSMMINMESYINAIRKDRLLRPEKEKLAEQRVIFWGSDTYSNLVSSKLTVA